MPNEKQPLITICCFVYNQEDYVEESINSLLAQDYSPLEIIISDDFSTDNTYEIVKAIVDRYSGQHKVILLRNSRNLGLVKHVSKCFSVANGEYIYLAAGDDLAKADRVSRTHRYWVDEVPQAKAVFTGLTKINDAGEELGAQFSVAPLFARNIKDFKAGIECWTIGASLAFHRSLYDEYGGLPANVVQEDGCIAFRAILEGGIEYFDFVTVYYRHHGNNLSQNLSLEKKIRFRMSELFLYESFLKDALRKGVPSDVIEKIERLVFFARVQRYLLKMKPVVFALYYLREVGRALKSRFKNEI